MKKIKLKGGSLSSTSLLILKNSKLVRKEISLTDNREYGYVRWYSQLKRIQRYNIIFPNLFPKLIDYGINEGNAYFDIEYFDKSVNAYEYVSNEKKLSNIDTFFNALIKKLDLMHENKLSGHLGSVGLYVQEEVIQKLKDCDQSRSFKEFKKYSKIVFNGQEIPSLQSVLDQYCSDFLTNVRSIEQCLTHGNLTLENILYDPNSHEINFIDPYDENIIDSELCEFSQILQSSNGKYEYFNSTQVIVNNNVVQVSEPSSESLEYFNLIVNKFLKNKYDASDYKNIKLFEISQFIRMLRFKMHQDENKMIFFYSLASKLYQDCK